MPVSDQPRLLPAPLLLVSVLTCLFFSSTPAKSDNQLATAIALYNKQQYAAALQAFSNISEREPGNTSALYYAANCEIGLGRTAAAIGIYKRIVDRSPESPEAASARAVLQRMGAGASSSSSKSGSQSKSSDVSLVSGGTAGKRGEITSDRKNAIIDKIVVKVRALAGRPEVSSQAIDSVKDALKEYPTPLLGVLDAKGCKIFITPTMIDKEPELANSQPAGYEEGSTFKNCPGMFNGNVILCENRFIGDGPDLEKSFDIVGTLRHELGHAVDWYLGNLTAKDDFKHQYLLDLGTIDDGIKNRLAYYCQKDRRGPAETFAEIMCYKYGGRPNGNERTALVGTSFKLTRTYVDRIINQVDDHR